MDVDMPAEENQKSKSETHKIDKLRDLTGRPNSIVALKDFVAPNNLQEATAYREIIEQSDRLKKKLGERPGNTEFKDSIRRKSTIVEAIENGEGSQLLPQSPRRNSLDATKRIQMTQDTGPRRNSVDAKVTKRKSWTGNKLSNKSSKEEDLVEEQEKANEEDSKIQNAQENGGDKMEETESNEEDSKIQNAQENGGDKMEGIQKKGSILSHHSIQSTSSLDQEDDEFERFLGAKPRASAHIEKIQKLRHLTGRDRSLAQIEDLLVADSQEKALENAKLIEKSDKMKKVFGERPPAGKK